MENPFGWASPETNLMSWSLSSLCLKEYCSDLILYTDSEGAHILVDKLQLPYIEVVVCYDKLECPPTHWVESFQIKQEHKKDLLSKVEHFISDNLKLKISLKLLLEKELEQLFFKGLILMPNKINK